MSPIYRIAVIGECMVELKKNDGTLMQGFGGDTLNTAVYLSRLTQQHGISTSYITDLGEDPFSKEMKVTWKEEGLNTDMVNISKDKLPGMYAIETEEDGERNFYYWRNDSAAKYWLRDRSLTSLTKELCQHQMVYLSGISLAILSDEHKQRLIDLLSQCRKNGLKIVFDNNYRPALWENQIQAQLFYKKMLSITDIAFLTYDDEQMLYDDEQEQQTIERTQKLGVKEIVIKRGGDNCYVITPDSVESIAPHSIDNIVDTTAAGDSFSAGYLAKRMTGGSTEESAQAGHLLAGNVIQHRGAIIMRDAMPNFLMEKK